MNACSYCTSNQQIQSTANEITHSNQKTMTANKCMYALHYTPLSATLLAYHYDSYRKDPFKEQRTDADLPVGYCKKGLSQLKACMGGLFFSAGQQRQISKARRPAMILAAPPNSAMHSTTWNDRHQYAWKRDSGIHCSAVKKHRKTLLMGASSPHDSTALKWSRMHGFPPADYSSKTWSGETAAHPPRCKRSHMTACVLLIPHIVS